MTKFVLEYGGRSNNIMSDKDNKRDPRFCDSKNRCKYDVNNICTKPVDEHEEED